MDCFSNESEFIESLDFLSPPVKRIHSNGKKCGSAYNNDANHVHLLRGLRNKFGPTNQGVPSTTINTRTVKTTAESSTSLVLKKTSDKQILEHYSVLSYTNLQHPENDTQRKVDRPSINTEKQLIRVTVIPKTEQIQTTKNLRKARYIPKAVQSTKSNHENSVQTKNVYLIVAGRRREKIYEIKTTGSAKLSSDRDSYNVTAIKNEDIPVKELSNFTHLLQSLNMDRKKKKKNEKIAVTNANEPHLNSSKWKGYPELESCLCPGSNDDTPKKSHVRIFGQFGISEDDNYVLRYGATVDDKEVMSDVAQLTRDFLPVIDRMTPYGTTSDEQPQRQRDSGAQANYHNIVVEKLPGQAGVQDEVPSKESQGTQVNFNAQVSQIIKKTEIMTNCSDKKIQCNCCSLENKSEGKCLKDCQSPLVIISVYPKKSPEDITKSLLTQDDSPRCPAQPKVETYKISQILKTDKGLKNSNAETRRSWKSPIMGRSASPIKKISKPKVQDEIKAQNVIEKSPERQKALKAIKEKIQEKDKLIKTVQQDRPRKSSKFDTFNSMQVSKHRQEFTVSNATQIANKNEQLYTASNGTQVSARNKKDYRIANATQNSNIPQSLASPIGIPKTIVPIKHSKNAVSSVMYPKSGPATNATHVPKTLQSIVVNHATQVSKHGHLTISNATHVSRNQPNFIASRGLRNKETYISPHAVIPNKQNVKPPSRIISERGTNTDHARAKRALVDTYTKRLTEQMNRIPNRFDTSKVTINIDGDTEYYDVLFNQDKLTTDVTIRKTLKDMGSQMSNKDERGASLENIFYLPNTALDPGNHSPTKSMSIALYNNQSDDESPLIKQVSRLSIRDSIEISHRRENKSHHNDNIKNTQTYFTGQFTDNVPDETEFLAPIKHYTGDDCSICDPIARDKQIRELLGVDKNRQIYCKAKTPKCENDDRFSYQSIYRQECKKSQMTAINFVEKRDCRGKKYVDQNYIKEPAIYQQLRLNRNILLFLQDQFPKQRPIILSRKQYNKVKKSIQKTISTKKSNHDNRNKYVCNKGERSEVSVGQTRARKTKHVKLLFEKGAQTDFLLCNNKKDKVICPVKVKNRQIQQNMTHDLSDESEGHYVVEKPQKTEQLSDQCAEDCRDRRRKNRFKQCYNQANWKLDPNTAVLGLNEDNETSSDSGQSEQSRERNKEPNKTWIAENNVKTRNVQNASPRLEQNNEQKRNCNTERYRPRKRRGCSRQSSLQKRSRSPEKYQPEKRCRSPEGFKLQKGSGSLEKKCPEERRATLDKCSSIKVCPGLHTGYCLQKGSTRPEKYSSIEVCPDPHTGYRPNGDDEDEDKDQNHDQSVQRNDTEVKTVVLFNADDAKEQNSKENDARTRKTMSSVEIHYASIGYMKQMAYSSTDVGALSDSSFAPVNSFQTIFRGHRKSPTPNLGTSVYSLYSDGRGNSENKSTKFIMEPRDSKPKKPFLRRLMSCLVMRSARDDLEFKLSRGPVPELPSVNSSIDSYHISTSLGAVEVSSSIYDTSASFYSNHSILQINSKIKKGFFSSVRGFLTNRKS